MMVSGILATEVMVAVSFTVDSETQCSSEQYNVMTWQTSKCLQDNTVQSEAVLKKAQLTGPPIQSTARAYVRVGELVFRHHFKVLEILPDVVLGLHGFEAIIGLSTGRSGTRTSNMVRVRTGCLSMNQDIPPSCSFKPLRSCTFFRYFHPVPRKRLWLEILPHMPRNAPTYTRRHTSSTVLTSGMSPKRKMVSPMRSAAIWILSTFRCRNSKETCVELISRGIKCFCAAYLDPQWRSIKCTRCKPVMTMTGSTPLDANCRFDYTSGRTSTTGRRRSMETYLRINLLEIIEYASTQKTIHRRYTLTKWTRVN